MEVKSKSLERRSPILSGQRKLAQREKAFSPMTLAARWQRGIENLTKEVLKLEKQREKSRAGIGR